MKKNHKPIHKTDPKLSKYRVQRVQIQRRNSTNIEYKEYKYRGEIAAYSMMNFTHQSV